MNAAMKVQDKGFFVRIQKNGLGWNPDHKSFRPPVDWKIGDIINPAEGTKANGLAAFEMLDLNNFLIGNDFIITDSLNENVMDWNEIDTDRFMASDALANGYEVIVFCGEIIEILPDGYIVHPIPIEEVNPKLDADVFFDQPLVGGIRTRKMCQSYDISYPLPENDLPLPSIVF